MGESLSKLFVPLHSLPGLYALPEVCVNGTDEQLEAMRHPTLGGTAQLLFLAMVYGNVLFHASTLISDGSELLLLIEEIAPIVGSVVIPILGAVPDGAMVLFSGLGKDPQKELTVGVGALAGSTIMLLTVPMFLSVVAGRVGMERVGDRLTCTYSKPPGLAKDVPWNKLPRNLPFAKSLRVTGVQPDEYATRSGIKAMLATSISYFIIQTSAFVYGGDADIVSEEKDYALGALLLCIVLLVGYLYVQIRNSKDDQVLEDVIDRKREAAIHNGLMSLKGAFFKALSEMNADDVVQDAHEPLLSPDLLASSELVERRTHNQRRFKALVRRFFHQFDKNGDGSIDKAEFKALLSELGIAYEESTLDHLMMELDSDGSGSIQFEEFLAAMTRMILAQAGHAVPLNHASHTLSERITIIQDHHESGAASLAQPLGPSDVQGDEGGSDDEEESAPDDLAHLPPQEQRRRIIRRSLRLMLTGTVLVLLFSDPMVDVLNEIGGVLHVNPFYVSFILAPLASNASELIASFSYAQKKTRKTITISVTSLLGAATFNNSFCLSIFLSIIYFRGLAWDFSAETIAIIFVEFSVAAILLHKVITVAHGIIVLLLLPASLLLVYTLENVLHLK